MDMSTLPFPTGQRVIGAMLVDSGKLTVVQAEQVMRLQKETGSRFGEAAVQLGVLSEEDLRLALANQYQYPLLHPGRSAISEEVVVAYRPHLPQAESLRALRIQLLLRWFAENKAGRRSLCIVGMERCAGRSYLAANLAVAFSQLGEPTLLLDADMRHGRQHQIFQVENHCGLSTYLAGRTEMANVLSVGEIEGLSILTAGPVPPNPQELLGRETFPNLLDELARKFRVIIIDTPAAAGYADAQMISVCAGGSVIVARKHVSRIGEVVELRNGLGELGVSVVGAVLGSF
jgi:protein-tyrosine kinase